VADHDGIAAIIKNAAGEVLVQEHVKFGFWTIPVGKVKTGQDVPSGLRDEIFEECNLEIQESKELCVKDYFYERHGRTVKVVSHLFEILKYSGEVINKEPNKHRQQLFMPIDKIVKLPYLSDVTILYLGQIGFERQARL
jgi:ADP-ribose pyrophosphatase YjhB (NUDIX family)